MKKWTKEDNIDIKSTADYDGIDYWNNVFKRKRHQYRYQYTVGETYNNVVLANPVLLKLFYKLSVTVKFFLMFSNDNIPKNPKGKTKNYKNGSITNPKPHITLVILKSISLVILPKVFVENYGSKTKIGNVKKQ